MRGRSTLIYLARTFVLGLAMAFILVVIWPDLY